MSTSGRALRPEKNASRPLLLQGYEGMKQREATFLNDLDWLKRGGSSAFTSQLINRESQAWARETPEAISTQQVRASEVQPYPALMTDVSRPGLPENISKQTFRNVRIVSPLRAGLAWIGSRNQSPRAPSPRIRHAVRNWFQPSTLNEPLFAWETVDQNAYALADWRCPGR